MPRTPGTHVDDAGAVGVRLRTARKKAELSQRELAYEGCTAAYISRIEAGVRIPSLQVLRELGRRLGVSAEWLATGADPDGVAALLAEAEAATRFDELDHAEAIYRRVLEEEPSPADAATAVLGLAEIAFRRGDHSGTIELLEGLPESDLTPAQRAWAADRGGRAYALLGEQESSLAIFERALDRAQSDDDRLGQLRFSMLLANALMDGGNLGRAEELLAQALATAEAATDPVDLARVWWTQSRLHIQRDHPDVAARYARKAIALLEASEHAEFAAIVFQLLARIENDRGNGDEALALLERGLPAVRRSGNEYYLALLEFEQARALVLTGDREEAAAVAMSAAGRLKRVSPSDAGHAYKALADVFLTLDDADRAVELYELAADELPEGDPLLADVHARLGELFESQGHEEQALQAYKAAAHARSRSRLG